MDFWSIASGVVIAVLGALIYDEFKSLRKKIRKTAEWKKVCILFCACLIACVVFSIVAATNFEKNTTLFALSVAAVIESSASMIALFVSYARAFFSLLPLTEKLLDSREKNIR